MIDIQEKLTEQLDQFTQLQKEALTTLQEKGTKAADSFEKMVRFNQRVLGDVADFAVGQAKLVAAASDPKELVAQQIDSASQLAKLIETRTGEYIELVTGAAEKVQEEISETVEKASKAAKN